jgi:uncharacterized OB-fold protein
MSEFDFTSTAYYNRLGEGKLIGSRCAKCGEVYLPPRPYCPACAGSEMEEYEFSGKGKLAAYTVIYIAPTAMIEAGFNRKNPYCAGVVELEEGPRISAQILGVDVEHPESIRIGTPLNVSFVKRGEGEASKTYLGFHV